MSRRLRAVVLSVCAIASITSSTRGQGKSETGIQGIVLEMSIIEVSGVARDAIDKLERNGDQLVRLVNEGKARLITNLRLRTRPGESFKAAIGHRVPIQTATLPAFQASGRSGDSARPQTVSLGVSQIAYENTGLIVEGGSVATSDGLVDIRLNLEVTGLDRSTGSLTPTFTLKSLAGVVRMKINETAVLMGLTEPERPSLSDIASGTDATRLIRGSFIVLLTTKALQ